MYAEEFGDPPRHIYVAAGFTLAHQEREHAFGKNRTAQEWVRELYPLATWPSRPYPLLPRPVSLAAD